METAGASGRRLQLSLSDLAVLQLLLHAHRHVVLLATAPARHAAGRVGTADEFVEDARGEAARQLAPGPAGVAEREPARLRLHAAPDAVDQVTLALRLRLLRRPQRRQILRPALVDTQRGVRLQIAPVPRQNRAVPLRCSQPTRGHILKSPLCSVLTGRRWWRQLTMLILLPVARRNRREFLSPSRKMSPSIGCRDSIRLLRNSYF